MFLHQVQVVVLALEAEEATSLAESLLEKGLAEEEEQWELLVAFVVMQHRRVAGLLQAAQENSFHHDQEQVVEAA